ncbi:MAG TPA: hypothetical protein VI997_08900 [Candidatus Thermoplasmatota archaeon]|nr:hypothetical protein [Candidatus Thermoplasmatota archaeon]
MASAGIEVLPVGTWLSFGPAVAMLLVAATLAALRAGDRAVRAFALLLFLRAMTGITYNLGLAATDPTVAEFWWRTVPYFLLPLLPVAAIFALYYPRPLGAGRSAFLASLVAVVLVLEGAYLVNHAVFWGVHGLAAGPPGPQMLAPIGPLFVAYAAFELGFAVIAWLCLREWRRAAPGPRRTSILLVAFGFSVVVVYDTLGILLLVPEFVTRHAPAMQAALAGSLLLALALVAWSATGLAARTLRAEAGATRTEGRRFLLALTLPVVSVGFSLLVERAVPTLAPLDQVFAGLWRLVLPLVVGYALVRHNLFDIDLKIKWGFARGTLAAMFAAVFFVVAETAQQFLSDAYGYAVGGAAAALLLFALHPLQRVSGRVSDALLPRVTDTPSYRSYRKLVVYRAAVEGAWADDELTPRELEVLRRLREELDISAEDAAAVEADVISRGNPGAVSGRDASAPAGEP